MTGIILYHISEWLIRLIMLIYVPQRRDPNAARAWLLLIFLFPWPGLAAYLLIGRPYVPHRRRHLQQLASRLIREKQDILKDPAIGPIDTALLPRVQLAECLGDFGVLSGNEVELLDDYEAAIAALVADIDAARHHAHLLYYIFADDKTGNRIGDALARAVQRGVVCRLLVDANASKRMLKTLAPKLREMGVEVMAILPPSLWRRFSTARIDLRNHRKIAVVDGIVAHVGSLNIVDADFKPPLIYEEVVCRVRGPIVHQLQAVFLVDRFLETHEEIRDDSMFQSAPAGAVTAQVLPSGPTYASENNHQFILSLIYSARERIVITSPYFIPDAAFVEAMKTAALRGLDVRLVVAKQIDQYLVGLAQRSFYDELLAAGIRIHAYTRRFLHAKHISIDDDVCLIGSSNMDIRSFILNAEVMLILYDAGISAKLRAIQERYFADSEEITLEAWRNRPRLHRVLQNTARLADSLL